MWQSFTCAISSLDQKVFAAQTQSIQILADIQWEVWTISKHSYHTWRGTCCCWGLGKNNARYNNYSNLRDLLKHVYTSWPMDTHSLESLRLCSKTAHGLMQATTAFLNSLDNGNKMVMLIFSLWLLKIVWRTLEVQSTHFLHMYYLVLYSMGNEKHSSTFEFTWSFCKHWEAWAMSMLR